MRIFRVFDFLVSYGLCATAVPEYFETILLVSAIKSLGPRTAGDISEIFCYCDTDVVGTD